MTEKAPIRIIKQKPNPYSKETRPTHYAEFRLQDLAYLCAELGIKSSGDVWLRLPKDAEPGDTYEVLLSENGNPFLAPSLDNSLLSNPTIFVSDDMHVWAL